MATGYTTRKLEVYTLNARTKEGPVDYAGLFRLLKLAPPERRKFENEEKVVGVPELHIDGNRVFLKAVEGPKGFNPIIYNATNSRLRIERLRPSETLVTITHCMIDLASRESIVEYNHRGAKADHVAEVFSVVARAKEEFQSIMVDFNPQVDRNFFEAIANFDRVRVGTVKIARPNMDWNDSYNHLNLMGEESNAHLITLELTAGRQQSLSRDKGIIGIIREMAKQVHSALKAVTIRGVRRGETAETAVSLANHIEHQKINVKINKDGHVDTEQIKNKMSDYLNARSKRAKTG